MAPDAPSGLRLGNGKMLSWRELEAYKAAIMKQHDGDYKNHHVRLMFQCMRDPHYTEKK